MPAPVRAAMTLDRRERVLAAAPLVNRRWVVGTTTALHVVDPEAGGASADESWGWDRVAAVVWSDTASMLQVSLADERRQLELELAGKSGYLPEVIRERVEASVVISRRIPVTGRRGVRVAIRRAAPGAALTTQVVADHGVDVDEPDLAARIAAELADLREQAGMPA